MVININENIHKAAKIQAAQEKIKLYELIETAIKEYIEKRNGGDLV